MKHPTAQIRIRMFYVRARRTSLVGRKNKQNTGTQRTQDRWRLKMPWLFAKIEKQRVLFRGILWSHWIWNFGLCSNCSQKLDECSLARARKFFASARLLGFSLNSLPCSVRIICTLETKNWHWKQCLPCGKLGNIGETCARHECFWKNTSSFSWRLLKLTGQSSVPGSKVTLLETFRLYARALFNSLERKPTCL